MSERDLVRLVVTLVATLGLGVSVLYGRLLLRSAVPQLGMLLGGLLGWTLGAALGGGFGGSMVAAIVLGGVVSWLAVGMQTPLLAVLGALGGAGAMGALGSAAGLSGQTLSLAMLGAGLVGAFASTLLADVVAAGGAAALGTGLLKVVAEAERGASGRPVLDWRNPEQWLGWQFPGGLQDPLARVLCVGGAVLLALWLVRIQGLQFGGAERLRGLPRSVRRSGWAVLTMGAVAQLAWVAPKVGLGRFGLWLGAPEHYLGITLERWAFVVIIYQLGSAWAWNRGPWMRAAGALAGALAVTGVAGALRVVERGAAWSTLATDLMPTSVVDPDLYVPVAFAALMLLATAGRR